MNAPTFPAGGPEHHVAQVNIGEVRGPLDSPMLAGFMSLLEPINALADRSPGFVWRLQTEAGDATSLRPYDDDRIMINLSVWESLPALWNFVYASRHLDVLRRRREWFQRMADAYTALWWVEAGRPPTVVEAVERLEALRRDGPSPQAFTFKATFPPPPDGAASSPTIEGTPWRAEPHLFDSRAAPTRRG
jgi:hypothetical protein